MSSVPLPKNVPCSPAELLDFLAALGIKTRTMEHEAVFTVAQSSELHDRLAGGHTKNLFVKDKKDNLFLIVAGAHVRIEMNRIHPLIGAASRVSFANADLLMAHLGVEPGSVTAFSPVNDRDGRVSVIIDEPLLANDEINCHPLTNTMTTTISREDLLRFLEIIGHKPRVLPLSVQADGVGENAPASENQI
jgi:Ala-tRNA(Pro) deacylase